ncbi:cAMP-specific 3',5'-cyclic phosphodiesterase-like isoform X1 [Anastrepha ludens]|uniref:cAMP-specific 3',5'-cyclic phosphodiesterase-like isoform X1 n=1 Tax=Anastrepha ludens TaxID=28586 RepID=UPI0023B0E890|nr:cAMP-specific 3',5'-cyclic phosphodiesterase-like isoform X1 [Anastrepha ludens]
MRLSKITHHIGFKNGAQKFEQQQQIEHTAKTQATAGGKRFSGSHSIYSNSNCGSARGSGSGSGSGASGGAATNNRGSIGNGSCVSSSTTSASAATSTKKRKSKPTKCFSSTVFRCCIPCRGGGSAAPATSPPHSSTSPVDDVNNGTTITSIAAQKKCTKAAYDKKRDGTAISAPRAELEPDVDADIDAEVAAVAANGKRHSLADTIATSATTPISLKTLINDSEEELEHPQLSVADIAAATLATGIVARKAEPETLSDASVSPTAAIQQLPFVGARLNAALGTPAGGSSALGVGVPAVTTFATAIGQTTTATTLQQQQQVTPPPPPAAQSAPRVSQSQTSPLPHIKEEEESEHSSNRQQYSPPADAEQSAVGTLNTVSDSSESTHAPASTNTSVSAPTSGGAGGSSAFHCHQELVTPSASTPSPRIKLKFRKQHKSGWSRSVFASSSATGTSGAGGGGSSGGGGGGSSSGGGGGSGSGGATSNETLASNGSNTNTATSASSSGLHRISLSSVPHVSSSQLLPATKMQAEQGSIGDLQKYHSRYLKNRRHTLANVR